MWLQVRVDTSESRAELVVPEDQSRIPQIFVSFPGAPHTNTRRSSSIPFLLYNRKLHGDFLCARKGAVGEEVRQRQAPKERQNKTSPRTPNISLTQEMKTRKKPTKMIARNKMIKKRTLIN